MSIAVAASRPREARALPRQTAVVAAFLLVCALFLFLDARTTPIVLWDESRNVVNALEMRQNGIGLVTTYDGAPDLWNTKPPLLIWLMSASTWLFGASEFSLRLPSALAALGTLLITVLFARRVTGSLPTALVAGAMLALSPGFFGEHGARTADYDALLLFFVTSYLVLLFFAVHSTRPGPGRLVAVGALIGCALLTKSSAALVPGIGVAGYMLATGRVGRLWRTPGYVAMAAVAAALFLAFVVAREVASPGYVSAALHNDLLGRLQGGLIRRQEGPEFYALTLLAGWFFAGPLLLALPLAFRRLRGKSKAAFLFSVAVAAGILVPISFAGTKLPQYALSAFPALAVATAIALRALAQAWIAAPLREGRRAGPLLLAAASALLVAHLAAGSAEWRYRHFPARLNNAQSSYGILFEALAARGVSRVAVMDEGIELEGTPGYVPLLGAYRLMARERGLLVVHRPEPGAFPVVASCDPRIVARLAASAADIAGVAGCVATATR